MRRRGKRIKKGNNNAWKGHRSKRVSLSLSRLLQPHKNFCVFVVGAQLLSLPSPEVPAISCRQIKEKEEGNLQREKWPKALLLLISLTSSFALKSFTPDSWIYKKRRLHKELSYNTTKTVERGKKRSSSSTLKATTKMRVEWQPKKDWAVQRGRANPDAFYLFVCVCLRPCMPRHQEMFITYDS